MKCSNCGVEMPDGSVFCTNCGSKVPAVCPQCGTPVKPGAIFCLNCGKNLTADRTAPQQAPYQPPQQQPAAPNRMPQQQPAAPYQQPYMQQAYAPGYGQPIPPAAAKPKRKGWLIALIVILVVALAGTATYLFAGKQIKRLILGPKASYLAIEGQALKQDATDLVDDLVKLSGQNNTGKGGSSIELNLSLNEDKLGLDPTTAAALENITFDTTFMYNRESGDPRYYANVDLKAKDEKLLTLQAFIEQDKVVVGLPGILNQYIVAQGDELGQVLGMAGTDTASADSSLAALKQIFSMDMNIDQPELQKSLHKLIDIVLAHIDDAAYQGGQTLKAGDVSAQYDLYTITLSSKNARKMMLELCKAMRDDEQIYNLAGMVYGASNLSNTSSAEGDAASDTLTLEAYQASLDQMIQEFSAEEAEGSAFTIVQKLYVGGNDQIFGRDIVITGEAGEEMGHFVYSHPVAGEKEALVIAYESGADSVSFESSYTNKNGKKTGDAVLSSGGSQVLSLSFTDLIRKTFGSRDYLLGSLELTASDSAALPGAITYKGREESGRLWMDLGLADYGSLEIGYQEMAAGDAVIPSYNADNLVSASDSEALQGLMTEDVMAQLSEIMAKLGLSPSAAQ
ncbi:MAG: DUF6583 family protein [Clostridiaceae bacterium]|nr:DUF6583 family protein [Clostridiaceae bacterium]